MKKILTLLFLSLSLIAQAQKSYSYITDRRFTDPEDLLGYNFRPSVKEIKDVSKTNIAPGAVGFGITQNNLYVEGEGIQGVYNLNNINPTEYGYKLSLMNARDATIQGHLKVIIGKNQYAQAVIFLRSGKDKEMIFLLPEVPKDLYEKERKHFTDKNEQAFIHQDSIYGKIVRPFLTQYQQSRIQERLEMRDSCYFKFIEKTTIIDKTKKKDKEAAAKDSIAAKTNENLATKATDKPSDKKDDKKNIKIVKEHFAIIRQVMRYQNGTTEDKSVECIIKTSSLKEDKSIDFDGDRFLLQLDTNKGEINIYLNGNKMVNSIEAMGKTYYVRGF